MKVFDKRVFITNEIKNDDDLNSKDNYSIEDVIGLTYKEMLEIIPERLHDMLRRSKRWTATKGFSYTEGKELHLVMVRDSNDHKIKW